jgi:hypothetical protein
MLDLRQRARLLARTEEEIREEIAASLGRVTRRIERLLAEIEERTGDLGTLTGEARRSLVRSLNELRERTLHELWKLMVQREALGLRDHTSLRAVYRIPAVFR